jgi:hypothetical protein
MHTRALSAGRTARTRKGALRTQRLLADGQALMHPRRGGERRSHPAPPDSSLPTGQSARSGAAAGQRSSTRTGCAPAPPRPSAESQPRHSTARLTMTPRNGSLPTSGRGISFSRRAAAQPPRALPPSQRPAALSTPRDRPAPAPAQHTAPPPPCQHPAARSTVPSRAIGSHRRHGVGGSGSAARRGPHMLRPSTAPPHRDERLARSLARPQSRAGGSAVHDEPPQLPHPARTVSGSLTRAGFAVLRMGSLRAQLALRHIGINPRF